MPYPYVNNYPSYMNPQNYIYPQQAVQQQPTPQNSGIVWVQGEAGAKSYLVGAGQSVLLMDSESSTFYIKSTDASGMPLPLRVFDYKERQAQTVSAPVQEHQAASFDPDKFITREEFNQWTTDFKARLKATSNKKEVKDDGE